MTSSSDYTLPEFGLATKRTGVASQTSTVRSRAPRMTKNCRSAATRRSSTRWARRTA